MKKTIFISLVFFSIFQLIYGLYIYSMSAFDQYTTLYKWTTPLYIIMAILILLRKNIVRRSNIILAISALIFYSWGYFDLLIIRGFIRNWHNGFLFMSVSFHAPIIIFNSFIIFFLTRRRIKAEFPKITNTR
ncbi:MAG: hypothetical protein NTX01_05895 [Candidatus Omnitrophica bacterium]|nr:hypothetical protein [Candidatus Omnitrophota bacterium]